VVEGEAGRVYRAGAQHCAEGERLARGLGPLESRGDQLGPAQGQELGHRVGSCRVQRLRPVSERVHGARGDRLPRLGGHDLGVGDRDRRPHEAGSGSLDAQRQPVDPGQLGTRKRRRDRRAAQTVGGGDRLGRVDHTTAAEGDERAAADLAAHGRRRLGHPPARHLEHLPGPFGERNRVGGRVERSPRGD
jgi:hypothetical protein